jgi:hypothetical protein
MFPPPSAVERNSYPAYRPLTLRFVTRSHILRLNQKLTESLLYGPSGANDTFNYWAWNEMGARRQLSERQKSFARLVHEQVPAYRAYALAGYRRHHSNAYRLRENEGVKQYLSELEAQTVKRHEVTIDSLLTELEEARLNAKAAKQPSSEVSAVMGKAKLTGLLVDRQEVKEVSGMN